MSEATKAAHRDRLLAAAADAFATHGLHGARIDDISLAAGLAKGTIYNYFDSKEHLFRELIAAWAGRITDAHQPLHTAAPVRDQLTALVDADMAVMREIEPFARAAFREVLAPAADADLVPATDPVDDQVRAFFNAPVHVAAHVIVMCLCYQRAHVIAGVGAITNPEILEFVGQF